MNWWKKKKEDNYLNLDSAFYPKHIIILYMFIIFKEWQWIDLRLENPHVMRKICVHHRWHRIWGDNTLVVLICFVNVLDILENQTKLFELHCKHLTPIIQKTRVFGFLSQIFNLWQLYIDGNLITVHFVSHIGLRTGEL